jgi:ribonuclease P protein component
VSPVVADRLRDGRVISAVLRGRRKRAGEHLVVHVRQRDDELPARLAVVASRRVGGAVQRNRAKRLLREAARTQAWTPGVDVVLVARASCARSGLAEVTRELTDAVNALDLTSATHVSAT